MIESGKTPTKIGSVGVIPSYGCSVGFRGHPRFSIVPIFPFPVLLVAIYRTSKQYDVLRIRRNAGYWPAGGGKGGTRRSKFGIRRKRIWAAPTQFL